MAAAEVRVERTRPQFRYRLAVLADAEVVLRVRLTNLSDGPRAVAPRDLRLVGSAEPPLASPEATVIPAGRARDVTLRWDAIGAEPVALVVAPGTVLAPEVAP